MGCGASTSADVHHQPNTNNNTNNNNNNNNKSRHVSGAAAADTNNNNTATTAASSSGATASDSLSRCVDKYINENGGAISSGDGNAGVCLMFTPQSDFSQWLATKDHSFQGTALILTYYDKKTGTIFSLDLPDEAALRAKRDAAGIPKSVNWALFVKSVAADIIKHKVRCSVSADGQTAHITSNITLAKNSTDTKPMMFNLPRASSSSSSSWNDQYRLFVEPSIRVVKNKRTLEDRKDKQKKLEEITATILNAQKYQKHLIDLEAAMSKRAAGIRKELDEHSRAVIPSNMKARTIERRLYMLQNGKQMQSLDHLYETGDLPPTLHLLRALPHTPKRIIPSNHLIGVLKNAGLAYKNVAHEQDANGQWKSMCLSANGSSKGLLSSVPQSEEQERQLIEGVLLGLSKVDTWEFDAFEMDRVSGGQALFCVTLALLLRLDLPRTLGIDMSKLVKFLSQIQAGYHPNPYHNSTHAADVTQISYFILTKGGLAQKCQLSKQEIFASILAAAIHDYDHPGFNNSFHNRTSTYLSTLYNDRSVLENHHLASAFELMQHPSQNILAECSEDLRKEIRETMCEIVLSTDMSMHQKIFSTFNMRLDASNNDTNQSAWTKVDDRRLGLSMAIKMADVSNTCRPRNLYLPWVHCLSQEFYHQGDHERALGMPISPFMDRDKHNDLARGQISFIDYVITPMFEAAGEFLPNLRFCKEICGSNRQYWAQF